MIDFPSATARALRETDPCGMRNDTPHGFFFAHQDSFLKCEPILL